MGGGITSQPISKNVLHIANFQASYKGNFVASLEKLSERLSEKGIISIYMFPAQGMTGVASEWINQLKDDGRNVYGFTDSIVHDTRLIRKLIKKHDIRIIHTHFISMQQYLSVLLATMISKTKVVMHFHNHSVQAYGLKNMLRKVLYRKCMMVGCSNSVYNNLCRDYPMNMKAVVNNGIQFDRLDNTITVQRSEYALQTDTVVCLIFGFDFYRKGVDLALKALNDLNGENIKYELLISLSKNFEYVEQEVKRILGNIPRWVHIISARSDVAALYNMCDLFLSPSREEGLPYSVLEAGYCKCGVLTSDIPAQAKLGIPYAVLHRAEDYVSVKEKIEIAFEKKKKKCDNIEEVRKYMHFHYSLDNWVNGIIDVYKSEWK